MTLIVVDTNKDMSSFIICNNYFHSVQGVGYVCTSKSFHEVKLLSHVSMTLLLVHRWKISKAKTHVYN